MIIAHLTSMETPLLSGAMGLAFTAGVALGGLVVFSVMRKLKQVKK